jgi:hypothetical protein
VTIWPTVTIEPGLSRQALPVKLVNQAGTSASDQITGLLVSISEIHHFIHEGKFFVSWADTASLPDTQSFSVLIDPNEAVPHVRITVSMGGQGLFELFENTTVTANGNVVTAVNKNRLSSRTAQTLLYSSPSVTESGNLIGRKVVEGGSGTGPFSTATGAETSIFEEYILNPDRLYLARLTNQSGGARIAGIGVDFYEL